MGRLRDLLARPLRLWRRSIQFRVVVSVLVLSATVAGIVGWLVVSQISQGLAGNRLQSSLAEARAERTVASDRLRQAGAADFDAATQLRQLVDSLVARGQVRGFEVAVIGPIEESGSGAAIRTSPGLDVASVPVDLRRRVETSDGAAAAYTRLLHLSGSERADAPGVVVGDQLLLPADGASYGIYLLFPMTEEQRTISLLQNALLTAGALALALIAGVTWLVTRQVVTPVRLVRRVAERITGGRLEERMHVAGEDDIARLASSFNHMTDELQRQIRQLEELSRLQRRFVSDVSHELRTPLTTVRMASELLHDAREDFDPVTARAAELLQNELDRFEALLADLLEISRFDAGAAGLDLDDVDLTTVAHRVVAATAPLATARGVEVRILDQGLHVAQADVRRVERIVRNLVTNAIDHAEGSDVEIRLASDEHGAALSVRDHGVGLGPGETSMVFNRFWRADPARARTSGGTGLGLAIASEDARLHGGRLQAWGRKGEGALFRLTLPRRVGGSVEESPLPLVPEDVRVVGSEE